MISIIIPTLNEEKIIDKTLRELETICIPHEIIISDGNSTDKTLSLIRKYTPKIVQGGGERRQTIAQARNAGAKIAKGEYLVFIDADCSFENPDVFFRKAVSYFENRNVAGLTAKLRVLPENETRADQIVLGLMNSVARFKNNVLRKGEAAGGEFQMVRRENFFTIGGFREDLVTREDRDMFFRLAKTGRIIWSPELTVFHTGRRAHTTGWPRLVGLFFLNTFFFNFFGRVFSKEWKPVR